MSLTSRRTAMARKRYKPEEIVAKLRQVDVLVSQGHAMGYAIRQIGVSEGMYFRWGPGCGGLKSEQVTRRAGGEEALLDLRTMEPTFERIFGENAMRLTSACRTSRN